MDEPVAGDSFKATVYVHPIALKKKRIKNEFNLLKSVLIENQCRREDHWILFSVKLLANNQRITESGRDFYRPPGKDDFSKQNQLWSGI